MIITGAVRQMQHPLTHQCSSTPDGRSGLTARTRPKTERINDISKSIYASVFTYFRSKGTGDRTDFESPKVDKNPEEVWASFWNGYKSENEIEDTWFEQIPLFFEIIHLKEFIHPLPRAHGNVRVIILSLRVRFAGYDGRRRSRCNQDPKGTKPDAKCQPSRKEHRSPALGDGKITARRSPSD
jgi:hypothetical protein